MFLRKMTAWAVCGSVGVVITLLAGCSNGSDTSLGPGANTTSQLRAVNAVVCANYNSLNFAQRVSTSTFQSNVAYGQASAYSTVPAGNGINDFAVNNGTAVAQGSFTLNPNDSNTLVAGGDCTQSSASGFGPTLFQYTDNAPTAAQLGGSAALRVINVAPVTTAGFSPIDVYSAGQPLSGFTNIAYGSGTSYTTEPAGTYNLTLHSHANNVLLTLPGATTTALASLNLAAGHSYTLFIIGSTSGVANEPFDVKVIQDK